MIVEHEEKRKRDEKAIRSSLRWPTWPFLAMRRSRTDESGVLFSDKELSAGVPTVYLIDAIKIVGSGASIGEMKRSAQKRYEYASVDAMLDDGWEVK